MFNIIAIVQRGTDERKLNELGWNRLCLGVHARLSEEEGFSSDVSAYVNPPGTPERYMASVRGYFGAGMGRRQTVLMQDLLDLETPEVRQGKEDPRIRVVFGGDFDTADFR